MNFLLPREDAENKSVTKTCFYCNKTFKNHQALGGHLKVHQRNKPVRYSDRFLNFVDQSRNPRVSLPNSQQSSSSGENPTPLTRATPFDFSRMISSINEINFASRSRFTDRNPGVAQTQIIMPPDFSQGSGSGATYRHNSLASRESAPAGANAAMSSAASDPSGGVVSTSFPVETTQASSSRFTGSYPGVSQTQIIMSSNFSHGSSSGGTYHHNSFASREFAPAGANAAMSSAALDPSSSVVATNFPVDSSLSLGSNGVCQFNNDESQISQANLLSSSGDDLQSIQGYNLGPPCSSLDRVSQSDERSLLMRSEGKRPSIADGSEDDDIMNASKRPRTFPTAHVEPENHKIKELSLFIDVDVSGSASETCFVAKEEDPESPDVDLSLHL